MKKISPFLLLTTFPFHLRCPKHGEKRFLHWSSVTLEYLFNISGQSRLWLHIMANWLVKLHVKNFTNLRLLLPELFGTKIIFCKLETLIKAKCKTVLPKLGTCPCPIENLVKLKFYTFSQGLVTTTKGNYLNKLWKLLILRTFGYLDLLHVPH